MSDGGTRHRAAAATKDDGPAAGPPAAASLGAGAAGPPKDAVALRAFVEEELGDPSVAVEAEGPEGEIAVLRVPAALLGPLLEPGLREEIVRRARQAGFRYAAVDLTGT